MQNDLFEEITAKEPPPLPSPPSSQPPQKPAWIPQKNPQTGEWEIF